MKCSRKLDAVDASAVRRFGERVMDTTARPSLAAVGPLKQLESYDIFASRFRRCQQGCRMNTGPMAFMRGLTFPGGQQPVIKGDGVYLRYPRMADYVQWSKLRHDSRAFLSPWEPSWATDGTQ